MLSEKDIENLIQPILDRQDAINSYVIQKIAQRVKEIGKVLPSDVHRLERILKSGSDVRAINKEIARLTGLNERDIKQLIKAVAKDAYQDAKPYYDYRQKPYIPFEKNIELQRIVKAVAKQTSDTYVNLSNARAFMIRDLKNPKRLIPTKISKTYYSIVDEAIQASQSGVIDYNTAMRRTLRQLSASGIRYVNYQSESGKKFSQQLDVAVKRNLMDGIRQLNQAVQDEVGKQYGADGKEITVHEHSAPDHEPIQGHQFTNEEYDKLQNGEAFEDVNGKKFAPIARHIGQYNCRHFTYSIIVGVNKPNFSEKQLEQNIRRNQKGYTDKNGNHYTLYECAQELRKMERDIRQLKRDIIVARESGDEFMERESRAKLGQKRKAYNAFSEACGLPRKMNNCKVEGFRK